ncbi:MAG: hypothetical protein CND66_04930 [Marine Group II euryarchaeote MED-G37]|nr:MAG: hypothetical protein CND66_04930 [Marine Group II euryarchaeote MED-G37]|tara:strand:+ start:1058 stop:1738 length:681 start_codon:yes stop_codon:yes gene_type:complete
MEKVTRAFIALFLVSVMPTISILFTYSWSESELQGQIFFVFAKLWYILIPVYWIYRIEESRLMFGETNYNGMAESLISGIIMFVVIAVIFLLFGETIDVELMKLEIGATGLLNLPLFIVGMIYWITINSLVEELVFRQFIGDRLLEITEREYITVFFSAAIFTCHHTVLLSLYFDPWQNALASLGIFIAGVTWSVLWLRHRSLFVCWLSHAIADLAVFGIAYLILF